MKYKMICSDLDDTLLNSERDFSPELKESIHRYVDAGGKFLIATGRMTAGVLPVARRLELHGELVAFQGAQTVDIDTGNILDRICIDNESAVKIARYIESCGHYFHTYVEDYFVTQKAGAHTATYADICKAIYKETIIPLSEYIKNNLLTPPKILICEDENKIPAILKDMQRQFGDKFLVNTSKPWLVEIIPNSINKAVGIDRIARKYNITKDSIICIGDSCNDMEMIKYAGLSAVVANGSEEVKKFANIIAPSCDDNGVGWLIDNYGFIK